MEITADNARSLGEALIDAAINSTETGQTCYVKWSADLNTAISVPRQCGCYDVLYVVKPVQWLDAPVKL